MGGEVRVPPAAIGELGRFAAISDPAGASLSLLEWRRPPGEGNRAAGHNAVCWNELRTPDPPRVSRFYGEIFGWSVIEEHMAPGSTYWLYKHGEGDAGGMMKTPPESASSSHWLPYIWVEDLLRSHAEAQELGASVLAEPTAIPNVGQFSVLRDPTGAVIALFQSR